MPKSAKIIIFISALLVFTGYLISNLVLPAVIRSQIKQRIESDCESCKFTSENINLKYFPTRIIATQVHFETGSPKNTFIQADIPQTIIHFSLKSLKHHLIKITSIVVDKPNVVVAEGDEKAKKSTDEKTIDDWKLEIDKVNLNEASFIYQREQHGKTGKLHISKLNAEISELGTTPERIDQKTQAKVTAELENSGALKVDISAMIFNKFPNINVDVTLALDHMDLNRTKGFFMNYDGVEIKGNLKNAQAVVNVRGNSSSSTLEANFENLSIDFHKTFERSGFTAVLTNIFSGVKSKKNRKRSAQSPREAEEPLVGWIFRSMKDAALKVATDR